MVRLRHHLYYNSGDTNQLTHPMLVLYGVMHSCVTTYSTSRSVLTITYSSHCDDHVLICLFTHFRYGNLDVVKYLVTKTDSDVNLETKDGETPLDLARG